MEPDVRDLRGRERYRVKQRLGGSFGAEVSPGAFDAVIVVVPGRQDRTGALELLVAGLLVLQGVLRSHHVHVLGVGIDVVSEGNETLRLRFDDGIPDGLWLVLFGTGAEGNA